jgi:transglutaminase-like putative cysteine protease
MSLKAKNISIKRWQDFWLALFALAAITLVAARLWATEWTGDLYVLVYITFLAGLSGLALGFSHFLPLISALFSILFGTFTIGWLFGTTVEIEMTWRERILNYLWWRLRIAIQQYGAGETVMDPILFLTIAAVLLWILASVSAFLIIRRGSTWPVLLPLGLVILVVGQYDQDLMRNTHFLMTFLYLTLLIIGRMTFLRNRKQWQHEGIHTTTETHLDLTRTLLIIATIILVVAWMIPLTPQQALQYSQLWDRITEPWDRIKQKLSNLFVAESPTISNASGFYGESMGLGSGSPTSEDTVLTIHADTIEVPGYRNYWRARSYDYYNDMVWSSSSDFPEKMLFPENFAILYPDWPANDSVSYTVTSEIPRLINLYTTGVPTWVSRPVQTITQPISVDEQDLVALITDPNLITGEDYQFDTQINVPTVYQLQNSSMAYPEWLDRYLQVPADFSADVSALAEDITTGLDNPYDVTNAITQYLRANIEYSRMIPPIPKNTDPIEWFLFESKMGFCNYYATSEILMLRSLGIPARIGVGFAQGEYDDTIHTYTVRKRDSHAWPEVYFVGYGWVVFEPTTAQPAWILPAGGAPAIGANTPNEGAESQMGQPTEEVAGSATLPETLPDLGENLSTGNVQQIKGSKVIWTIFITILTLLTATVVILIHPNVFKINIDPLPVLLEKALINRNKNVPEWLQRWSIRAQMSVAERAYRRISQSIKIMGKKPNPSQTPAERAQVLTDLLPKASGVVQDILHEYQLDKFSNHIVSEDRVRNAARQLRSIAINTRLRQYFSFGKSKE